MARHSSTRRADPLAAAIRVIAQLLALTGILVGAFVGWKAWGSGLDTAYTSRQEERATKTAIRQSEPDKVAVMDTEDDPPVESQPKDDELFAYLRVPSFSKQYRLPIWQSTTKTVLDMMGAGHYRDTAMPGAVGNSSYAGHNTYADMADIRLLKPGDTVYIETGSYWYRYTINSNPKIVDQTAVGEIAADGAGVERGLTLQTCWPIMTTANTTKRIIVHGVFSGWADKSAGTPADLAGTTDTVWQKAGRRTVEISQRFDSPVTGVLGVGALACWLLLSFVGWLFSHGRALRDWRSRGVGGPLDWMWRATPGVWQSNTVVYTATRLVPYLLLWAAVVFLFWRWACPVLDALPWVKALMGM